MMMNEGKIQSREDEQQASSKHGATNLTSTQ